MTCQYIDTTDGRRKRCRNTIDPNKLWRYCDHHRELIRRDEDPDSLELRRRADEIAAAHGCGPDADWEGA